MSSFLQLVSWAFFGTFLVIKGSFLSSESTGFRSLEPRHLTETLGGAFTEDANGNVNYTLPVLNNLLVSAFFTSEDYHPIFDPFLLSTFIRVGRSLFPLTTAYKTVIIRGNRVWIGISLER